MRLSTGVTRWLREKMLDVVYSRAPDFLIGPENDPYLKRWWVIPRNHLFNIYLHRIRKSDDDRALHDHPWLNASIILLGSYTEVTPDGDFLRQAGDVVWRRAVAQHRLVVSPGTTALSLFITGPKFRTWGFACPKGWIPWQEFCEPTNKGQVGRGCE